jgi:simple sugar transport system permease protein
VADPGLAAPRPLPPLLRASLRYAAVTGAALAAFAIVLLLAGKDPLQAYADVFDDTFVRPGGLVDVLFRMTPLLLTAVAVALPSRLGLVNVGGEGQLYMGAWAASAGALFLPDMPAFLLLPLVALLGFAGGALWAAIPGLWRSRKLVNETISTLLLNYVGPLVVSYFLYGPWRSSESSAYPQSAAFRDAARLPSFFGTQVHAGLLIGLAALVGYWVLVEKTRWGVQLRAIGGNPEAAERLGIPVATWTLVALAIGGGLAGLAGMGEVTGVDFRLRQELSSGYGYTGFLIAWAAAGRPLGILLMSFLLAVITGAGYTLQTNHQLPHAVVNILLAIILYIVLGRGRAGAR